MSIEKDFLQLARIALKDRPQDIHALLQRIAKKVRPDNKTLSDDLIGLLRNAPTRSSPLRKSPEMAVPVDADSRIQLLRIEESPEIETEPTYSDNVRTSLETLVAERRELKKLYEAGLQPTRTALFTGPPGVGKTLAARWLSRELKLPLMVLDLSSVMSSFLGRTGTNLRHVLDYAKSTRCVLLLDELDAIAKRRDDASEIGELKRLVTVLIQQLDDWPADGLLIAATNHAELLDPAIWRRFDETVEFSLPSFNAASRFMNTMLPENAQEWAQPLAIVFAGQSFSDIERAVIKIKRTAALSGQELESYFPSLFNKDGLSNEDRISLALEMAERKLASQRRIQELTGVSRDTIRTRLNS